MPFVTDFRLHTRHIQTQAGKDRSVYRRGIIILPGIASSVYCTKLGTVLFFEKYRHLSPPQKKKKDGDYYSR